MPFYLPHLTHCDSSLTDNGKESQKMTWMTWKMKTQFLKQKLADDFCITFELCNLRNDIIVLVSKQLKNRPYDTCSIDLDKRAFVQWNGYGLSS